MLTLNWNIIWTFVNLIILYILLKKFLFGPISAMMEKRAKEISDSLDQAASKTQEADALKSSYVEKLKNAEKQADEIVKSARDSARAERVKILDKAQADAKIMVQNADAQIARETQKTIEGIQSELASVAVAAAEKVTSDRLADSDKERIDDFISEVGAIQ